MLATPWLLKANVVFRQTLAKLLEAQAPPSFSCTSVTGCEAHSRPPVPTDYHAATYEMTPLNHHGFFKSPAGLTVVAGVFVAEGTAFCAGVEAAAGLPEFSFVITDSLKS